ncbi:polysaccharide deacetylase family protein [Mollicutes bacterium LVI A0039]|nr:polysaccharide deacetylase family protein [Mollicutes bacterium LVI A0039]
MKKNIKTIVISLITVFGLIGIVSLINSYSRMVTFHQTNTFIIDEQFPDTNGTLVLNYHQVEDNESTAKLSADLQVYNISIERFEEHMRYISENNINVLTLDQLQTKIKTKNFSDRSVVITFDDIDQSVYTNAFPILQKYNIPFCLFIVTSKPGTIDDERQYATWEQIIEMSNSGLATIGIHTNNLHYKVNGAPIFLDKNNIKQFETDLQASINIYNQYLHEKPKYFAYPYGYGIPETDKLLMDNGIELIFSLESGLVTETTEKFFIPRLLINEGNEQYASSWVSNEDTTIISSS